MGSTKYNLAADTPPDGHDEEQGMAEQGHVNENNLLDVDEKGKLIDPRATPLSHVKQTTFMEMLTGLVAASSAGSSITAIFIIGTTPVLVAGILASLVGMYAYWQQTQMTEIAALKGTHAALQREAKFLAVENTRLSQNVDRLSVKVDRLADVEDALDIVTQTQGKSVESFMEQVKANKELLKSMRRNWKASVLQNLISVVMRSDEDEDFKLDAKEVENLVSNLKSINGCDVNEEKLRQVIQEKNGAVDAVVSVIRDVVHNGNISDSDAIFTFPNMKSILGCHVNEEKLRELIQEKNEAEDAVVSVISDVSDASFTLPKNI